MRSKSGKSIKLLFAQRMVLALEKLGGLFQLINLKREFSIKCYKDQSITMRDALRRENCLHNEKLYNQKYGWNYKRQMAKGRGETIQYTNGERDRRLKAIRTVG